MPLIAISRANDWGWGSTRTLALIGAGLVVLAVWVAVERRTEKPLADIPTLIEPPVLLTNVATLFVGFGMFGSKLPLALGAAITGAGLVGLGLDHRSELAVIAWRS